MNSTRAMILPYLLILLNLCTAIWGLAFPEVYREPSIYVNGWSRATLVGVDLVSLLAFFVMPILLVAGRRGPRWNALWLGALFFSAYSHSFQVFTTSLNGKYPFHLAAFVLATWASLSAIQKLLPTAPAVTSSGPKQKFVAVWMIILALVLVGVWTTQWYGQLVAGFQDAHQAAAIQSIAALDLVMAFPAFLMVGIGLWRGRFSDSPIPTALNIAFGIYMAALAVATWTNLAAGTPGALKELPQWAGLALASAASAVAMLPAKAKADTEAPAMI